MMPLIKPRLGLQQATSHTRTQTQDARAACGAAVLLIQALSAWNDAHMGRLPASAEEKAQFRALVRSWQRGTDGVLMPVRPAGVRAGHFVLPYSAVMWVESVCWGYTASLRAQFVWDIARPKTRCGVSPGLHATLTQHPLFSCACA